jgi:[ribosomal protein S5]-alanine N-acetyltransferase
MSEKISINPIVLKGDRVMLQPISLAGLDDFHEYSTYKEFYNYFEFSKFKDILESKEYLQKLINRSESRRQQFWFIKENKSKKIIGSFGVHSLDEYRGSVEIGYGLSPCYWGKGYFQEAVNIVLDHIFNDLHLHRVVARTFESNQASIKGLERVGFKTEGVMRDYYKKHNGQRFNAVLMAKLSKN